MKKKDSINLTDMLEDVYYREETRVLWNVILDWQAQSRLDLAAGDADYSRAYDECISNLAYTLKLTNQIYEKDQWYFYVNSRSEPSFLVRGWPCQLDETHNYLVPEPYELDRVERIYKM